MSENAIHEGLVGYFDILGYQSILENNQIESVANIISDIVLNLPECTKYVLSQKLRIGLDEEKAPKKISDAVQRFLSVIQKPLNCLILSDSIIFSYSFDFEFGEDLKIKDEAVLNHAKWFFFIAHVRELLKICFSQGLPLRGAIDFGQYYFSGNCWAGKPIIDSYRLAGKLQMSGCAFTPNAANKYHEIPRIDVLGKDDSAFFFRYLTPLSNNSEEKMFVINWLDGNNKPADFKQVLVHSFSGHKKDISRKAFPKMENTEIFMHYALAFIREHFADWKYSMGKK